MKFLSGSQDVINDASADVSKILLFDYSISPNIVSAGAALKRRVIRSRMAPSSIAWDLLSIALSVVAADGSVKRSRSPDGWTRQIDLKIATRNPELWDTQKLPFSQALNFLTTDIWNLDFAPHGDRVTNTTDARYSSAEVVSLLSGGLDSLVGAIDLSVGQGSVLTVSQTVRGDRKTQRRFAETIGGGLEQIQLNHNVRSPRYMKETSQRSRSLIFLAFAVLAASTMERHKAGETVPLYICENGFIAINPALTDARLGSLSTRTAHPEFLMRMQDIFNSVELGVEIRNPYAEKTKGEMLKECADQSLLRSEAFSSTSCGRFQRFGYRQCGRCIPCQIRRAAFARWNVEDLTPYVYVDLGRPDEDHALFDDVRSVAFALASIEQGGLDSWIGTSLSYPAISNRLAMRDMIRRGIKELEVLHSILGVS